VLAKVQSGEPPADLGAVQSPPSFNEAAQWPIGREPLPARRAGLPMASARATLIDTRLVRAELARLRGPRPGTEIHRAGMIRSSIPAASKPRSLASRH